MGWLELTKERRTIIGYPLNYVGSIVVLIQLTSRKRNCLTGEHELGIFKKLVNSAFYNVFQNNTVIQPTSLKRNCKK